MAQVSDKFAHSFLNNKALEAIKPLNEMKDALHEEEVKLRAELDDIIQRILAIEF